MDILWPKVNDRLFTSGGYQALAGCIIPKEIGLVATGYKDAADALVLALAEQGRNDTLIFPIVFCYRQYLELQIKAITALVEKFEGTDEEFKQIHNLKKLWLAIKPRIEAEIEEQERETLATVEDCIMQFHDFDPTGMTFRYPEPVKMHQIDLGNLKKVMNRVSTFLESLGDVWEAGVNSKF